MCTEGMREIVKEKEMGWRPQQEGKGDRGTRTREGEVNQREGEESRRVPGAAAFGQRFPSKGFSSQLASTTLPTSHSWKYKSLH